MTRDQSTRATPVRAHNSITETELRLSPAFSTWTTPAYRAGPPDRRFPSRAGTTIRAQPTGEGVADLPLSAFRTVQGLAHAYLEAGMEPRHAWAAAIADFICSFDSRLERA